jgi:superfamily II DNA or RNA helicase
MLIRGHGTRLEVRDPDTMVRIKKQLTLQRVVYDPSTQRHAKEDAIFYEEPQFGVLTGVPVHVFGPGGIKVRIRDETKPIDLEQPLVFTCALYTLEEHTKPQVRAFDACVSALSTGPHRGGTLVLPCGVGKTGVALAVVANFSELTLVLVHKSFLRDQWIERIGQFLVRRDGTPVRIGIIQGDRCEVDDVDIVIGMMQTVCGKRDLPLTFGLVIVDEAHHVPTKSMTTALGKIAHHRSLALTATPKRKDGLTNVLFQYMGPVCYTWVRPPTKNVDVIAVRVTVKGQVLYYRNKGLSLPRMVTSLTSDKRRNMLITRVCIYLTSKWPERRILLLSDRTKQLSTMQKELGSNATLFTGATKAPLAEVLTQGKILLSTFPMAAEGLDVSDLDILVLCSPKSSIEQAVGRVLRGKSGHKPLIVDIADHFSVFEVMSQRRKRYYAKCGFTYREMLDVNIIDDPAISRIIEQRIETVREASWHQVEHKTLAKIKVKRKPKRKVAKRKRAGGVPEPELPKEPDLRPTALPLVRDQARARLVANNTRLLGLVADA